MTNDQSPRGKARTIYTGDTAESHRAHVLPNHRAQRDSNQEGALAALLSPPPPVPRAAREHDASFSFRRRFRTVYLLIDGIDEPVRRDTPHVGSRTQIGIFCVGHPDEVQARRSVGIRLLALGGREFRLIDHDAVVMVNVGRLVRMTLKILDQPATVIIRGGPGVGKTGLILHALRASDPAEAIIAIDSVENQLEIP